MLVKAVKDRDQDGNCILVASKFFSEAHVRCCQYWRWSDPRDSSELRRLPQCRSALDSVYACCNPNHWSRLCIPGKSIAILFVCAGFCSENIAIRQHRHFCV
ncbi:hypothetical protein GWI33_012128 [Rhynchophorus ferrugineus]|uniref:MH1 domain-containing protein n=1 Tax=Rhynchophorus ferrugineus TaxID=354439 RepID=A0A834MEE5_RHYFE|nr:hypothetical protein GWI33_012128 [Rhynchophorus ferrugineus]